MAVEDKSTRDAKQWDAVEEASELILEDRYPEAMLMLRDVIKAQPNNAYAYFWLGVAFFETKQMEAARDAYRAAVHLSPDYLGARVSLSHVLRQLGDLKGALAQANEALRRFPKDGEAMHAAGLAYAAQGKRAAAKKHLQGFLDAGPELEAATEVRQILEMLGLGEEGDPVEFE
ncbi:MAG: tetratricopeptide repeat protein [Byssovorax sp.]